MVRGRSDRSGSKSDSAEHRGSKDREHLHQNTQQMTAASSFPIPHLKNEASEIGARPDVRCPLRHCRSSSRRQGLKTTPSTTIFKVWKKMTGRTSRKQVGATQAFPEAAFMLNRIGYFTLLRQFALCSDRHITRASEYLPGTRSIRVP